MVAIAWVACAAARGGPAAAGEVEGERDGGARLAELRARLRDRPEDLDARLHLALLHSQRGERDEARTQVGLVVAARPEYWDAHLLLARLDAWDERYEEARQRVLMARPHIADRREADEMLVDIAIWAREFDEARRLIAERRREGEHADLYYKEALIEHAQLQYWTAWRLAGKALALDPGHAPARKLRSETVLVSADLSYELEVYPKTRGAQRFGHGAIMTAAVLPRAWLYITLLEEYRRRFGTDNQRLTVRGDVRVTPELQLTAQAGFGLPAHVVPRASAGAAVSGVLLSVFDGAVGYLYDRPAWGGHLHRLRFDLGAVLPAGLRFGTAYILGLVTRCGETGDAHGTLMRLYYDRGPIEAYVQYGFGVEVERPALGADVRKSYTSEGCPRPGAPPGTAPLPLGDLLAHDVGFQVLWRADTWLTLRAGYDLQLRFDETEVQTSHFAVRLAY